MFYVGSENDLYYKCLLLASFDVSSNEFEFPGTFDPLADTLECTYIL